MKRSLFLSATLLLIVACTSEEISIDMDTVHAESESFMNRDEMYRIAEEQSVAYNHYQRIMELMGTQTRDGSSQSEIVYPNYYGGAYINDDNKLVMLVKKEFATTRAACDLMSQIDDEVVITECEYSYSELQGVVDVIEQKVEQNPALASNIGVFGIIAKTNNVLVCLYDISSEKISLFRNMIIDTPMIVFEEATPFVDQSTTANLSNNNTRFYSYNTIDCGGKFFVNHSLTGREYGSVGYRAINNIGSIGFVTTAHTFLDSLGTFRNTARITSPSPAILGYVAWGDWEYEGGGCLDAAFVEVLPDFQITNRFPIYMGGDTLSTEILEPMPGQAIYMLGQKSLSETSSFVRGTVLCDEGKYFEPGSNNQVVLLNDIIISDAIGLPGDSGGTVFAFNSSVSITTPIVPHTVGIHKGIYTLYNGEKHSMCIKAKNINEKFGLTRY